MAANCATQRFCILLAVAVGVFCASPLVVARTITVGRSGCDYTGVQQAVYAAEYGDTVLVEPGSYYGTVKMNEGITLRASDDGEVRLYSDYSPVIMADDVSAGRISGFVLDYTGENGNSAVWLSNADVEIDRCTIRGATYSGIHVEGRSSPTVAVNTITGNDGNGVYIAGSSMGQFSDNDISGNTASGIYIRDGADPMIFDNIIHSNGENGILSCGTSTGELAWNQISGNGRKGIYVLENATSVIDSNTIFDNAQEGISVVGTSEATVSGNDIHDNEWAGVFAGGTANLLLHDNEIYRNHEAVCIGDEAESSITNNVLYENQNWGILARNDSSIHVEANTIRGNVTHGISAIDSVAGDLSGNQILDNGQRGVDVTGTARLNIRDNTISGNGREGIGVVRISRFPQGSGRMEVRGNDIFNHPHAGIFLGDRSDLLIARNSIHGNFEGICVSDEVEVDIESNTIYENHDSGVEIREDAIGVFSGNTIRDNDKCGIFASGAASGEIDTNLIEENDYAGVHLTEAANFLIQGNEISGNAYEGVCIAGSTQRTVSSNEITENGFAGIFVGETAGAILADNTLIGNRHEGICAAGQSTTTIRGNSISANSYVGIRTQDSAVGIIEGNTVFGNAEHGIFAIGSSSGEIRVNTIRDNILDGISIQDDASFVLEDNAIAGNGNASVTIRGHTSPEIAPVVYPSVLRSNPSGTQITIRFHDADGDVCRARIEVLEGSLEDSAVDLTELADADQVTGVTDGEFELPLAVTEPGGYRLQVTLIDEMELESAPAEFAFQAVLPNPPEVLGISVLQMTDLPTEVTGTVRFADLDADLAQARFDVLAGVLADFTLDLTQSPHAEQVVDVSEGEFLFGFVPLEAGVYTLQLTLVDATGLESEPYEFSFEAYMPTPPVVNRVTFTASVGLGETQNGLVRFEDLGGDIVEARFEAIEGNALTIEIEPGFSFDPDVDGETAGAFRFSVRVTEPQSVVLTLTLIDAAGLRSNPYEFAFDVR